MGDNIWAGRMVAGCENFLRGLVVSPFMTMGELRQLRTKHLDRIQVPNKKV